MKLKGSFFILMSAFFYGSYGIWSRLMAGQFGEFNQAWTRALILLSILIPLGIFTKQFKKIKKQDYKWFIAISLAAGLNQAPYFYGFEHLTIGTATLLFYIMLTLGSFFIGKIFFNEKLTAIKYFSLATATIGLTIIYKFGLTADQILPAIATMFAGLMGATCVSLSKKLSNNYSEVQILCGFFSVMVAGNILIGIFTNETFLPLAINTAWLAQFGYCAAMLIANYAVIIGFRGMEPSVGALLGLFEIIFAAIFGVILFKEVVTTQLLIGGALVIFGAALPDVVSLKSPLNKQALSS